MVVMYEDTSGTASLNTDLVGALSANNGSNFTYNNSGSRYAPKMFQVILRLQRVIK